MTVPNGAAGINTADGAFLLSAYGHGDMSAADLVGNDEDTVRAIYGQKYVTNGTSVLSNPAGPLASVFGGFAGIPGLFAAFIGKLFGVDLGGVTDFPSLFNAIVELPVEIAGQVAQFAGSVIQQLLLFGTGGSTTGTDPVSVLAGLISQASQIPGDIWALIFGPQATNQADVNVALNGGFSHDFASNGVTGWSNLVGTLVLSSRGSYIQAPTRTVAYRAGVAAEKLGAHMDANPSMRGVARLGICANTTGTDGADVEVYRGFDGDALRLVTRASPTLTVVQKQADFIGPNRLSATTAVDLKTDGVSQFFVLYNGQPVTALNWTDSTGIVPHNPTHRGVLLTSNGANRNQDGYYGPQIKKVVSYGW